MQTLHEPHSALSSNVHVKQFNLSTKFTPTLVVVTRLQAYPKIWCTNFQLTATSTVSTFSDVIAVANVLCFNFEHNNIWSKVCKFESAIKVSYQFMISLSKHMHQTFNLNIKYKIQIK